MAALSGKVAIVTGASSGIGEATARQLAREDAKVALLARRKERLEALANEIESAHGEALVIEADITELAACETAVKAVIDKWGRIDILVNNSGVMLLGPVRELPVENWERMINVNELGLLYMTRASMEHIIKAKGHFVNISSVAGRTTAPGSAVYNLTKWGVGAFTEALRKELVDGKTEVRTTIIEPGAVVSELRTHNTPETQEALSKRFGDIKILESDDIAEAIVFAVTRSPHVNINEILIRPTEQPS